MKHYPQYRWGDVLQESSLVLAALFAEIPDIHLKKAWPSMQLAALVGNAMGGKSKGGDPPDPDTVFKPEEFAPPWAAQGEPPPLEPQHCWALTQALNSGELERGASWVLQLVELADSIRRVAEVAEGYGGLVEEARKAPPGT